jgi:hypothetical protein
MMKEGVLMNFVELMKEFNITNPPNSWERNFNYAAECTNLIPSEDKLTYYQTVYNFPDLQLEQMKQFSEYILHNEALKKLWHLWYTILFITQDCAEEHYSNWPVPLSVEELFPGIFRALVIIAHTEKMLEISNKKNLPANFLEAGIKSFIHCTEQTFASSNFYGLTNSKMWWLQPYMLVHLFKLGRLQYEIAKFSEGCRVYENSENRTTALCSDEDQRYDEEGFESSTGIYHPHIEENPQHITGYGYDDEGRFSPKRLILDKENWTLKLNDGDDVLSIHIPGEGKLTEESVLKSIEMAKCFFKQYFPEKDFKAFISHTWLFNTQLKNLLPPTSNILAFQKLFTIVLKEVDEECIFDFVFDTEKCPLEQLIPKNSFQTRILAYVQQGGILRSGFGYLLLE